ncbi:MAG: PEP-utilizing enzyme [Candidatus Margulisiibacteriota bacterium]|jgi:phosphohistidine swiveling domain-containing protein
MKKNNINWVWYTRGTIQPFRADVVFYGLKNYGYKLNINKFYSTFYININDKLWWGWSKSELFNLGNKIFWYCSIKKQKESHFNKIYNLIAKAFKASEKVRNTNLTKLSNQEIISLFKFLIKETSPAHGLLNSDVDAIDFVSERFFKLKIKEFSKKISADDLNKIYNLLANPIYDSFSKREEKQIISLAIKNKLSNNNIKKLYKDYWWTKIGWKNMRPLEQKDFITLIKQYKRKKNLKKILFINNNYLKNLKKERNQIIKKYNINKKIIYWLDFFDKYAEIHELRKEMQAKSVYSFYLLLKEISKRKKVNIDDFEWLFFNEIIDILRGKKINYDLIKKRKTAVAVYITNGFERIYNGEEVIKIKKMYIKDVYKKSTRIIKGMGVSKGRVIGIAKVCSGAAEALKKVKKNDILVCGMTLPDYIIAMRKAAAIVTNEGGITCHAAIISRELGIPCVIGTKIATQVLKDGDRVEVDANKGIIKILS